MSDLRIPGYVRDPHTGRLYRIPQVGSGNELPSTTKFEQKPVAGPKNLVPSTSASKVFTDCKKDHHPTCDFTKTFSIPHSLMKQQWGKNISYNFLKQKLKTTAYLSTFQESTLAQFERIPTTVQFLKKSKNVIYGNWSFYRDWKLHATSVYTFMEGAHSSNHRQSSPVELSPRDDLERGPVDEENNVVKIHSCNTFLYAHAGKHCVEDMCVEEKLGSCLFYVYNDPLLTFGTLVTIHLRTNVRSTNIYEYECRLKKPYWCCNFNYHSCNIVVGSEQQFILKYGGISETEHSVPGNVHAAQFNERGTLVYLGLNTGKVALKDFRTRRGILDTRPLKLSHYGIDEVVPLRDGHILLCGDFSGKLCQVDLRNFKTLLDYKGYVHSPRKSPFSLDEGNGLLCATGTDNVTRLWDLNRGGDPVRSYAPEELNSMINLQYKPHVRAPIRSCLFSEGIHSNIFFAYGGYTGILRIL